jgi:hypothetical protein
VSPMLKGIGCSILRIGLTSSYKSFLSYCFFYLSISAYEGIVRVSKELRLSFKLPDF